jgi:phosphoglycolate phosphatase
MMNLRLVVFDVDGTLLDSQNHIVGAMTHAFTTCGHDLPARTEILSIVGLSLPVAMHNLVPHLPDTEIDRLVESYKHGFTDIRAAEAAPLYPGARAALDGLRTRDEVVMGVATGKSRRGLTHVLGAHDLASYFVTSQVADDHPSKPHPSMLQAAAAETGIARGIMVGDTEFDIAMGRAAGFHTLAVGWGYHPVHRLRAAGADMLIEDFAELPSALDQLWGRG